MRWYYFPLLILFSIFSVGCASVSVTHQRNYGVHELPRHVYIEPFVYRGLEFKVARQGKELERFQKTFQKDLQASLAGFLMRAGVRTHRVEEGALLPPGAWVVKGEILRVSQGSRAARSSVGFGLGGTKVETFVRVYQVGLQGRKTLVSSFQTSGGSNAEPGGGYYFPWTAPRMLYVALLTGLSYDMKRTSKQIGLTLLERMEEMGHGPLPGGAPKRPFILGSRE